MQLLMFELLMQIISFDVFVFVLTRLKPTKQ